MSLEKFKLDGKKTIVTGGAGGIGSCISRALADAGADICIADLGQDRIDVAVDSVKSLGGNALGIETDVLKQDNIDNMVDFALNEFGQIDIIVNCAGISPSMPSEQVTRADWNQVTGVCLDGVFFCAQAAGKHMIKRGEGGTIINIASAYGLGGAKFLAAYCAAKAGVVNLTRALAYEWAHYNIRVNAIAPGLIETDMTAPIRENPAQWAKTVKTAPMRRAGQPEEIADASVYLASQASSFMTGQTLVIDGGMSIL